MNSIKYFQASEVRKTAKEIGELTGVGEVTIRQIYKQMIPRAAALFPENFKFFIPISQLPIHFLRYRSSTIRRIYLNSTSAWLQYIIVINAYLPISFYRAYILTILV